jgi:hypothetical protein
MALRMLVSFCRFLDQRRTCFLQRPIVLRIEQAEPPTGLFCFLSRDSDPVQEVLLADGLVCLDVIRADRT